MEAPAPSEKIRHLKDLVSRHTVVYKVRPHEEVVRFKGKANCVKVGIDLELEAYKNRFALGEPSDFRDRKVAAPLKRRVGGDERRYAVISATEAGEALLASKLRSHPSLFPFRGEFGDLALGNGEGPLRLEREALGSEYLRLARL